MEYPLKMEVEDKADVTLRLSRTQEGLLTPVVTTTGRPTLIATIIATIAIPATPTPTSPPLQDGYRLWAAPTLTGDFVIFPSERLGAKQLDGTEEPVWTWSIRADSTGEKPMYIFLEVVWLLEGGEAKEFPPQTARQQLNREPLDIRVTKPFLTLGQLQLTSFLSGFIGSGLSVPFLYGLVKERRVKTRRRK